MSVARRPVLPNHTTRNLTAISDREVSTMSMKAAYCRQLLHSRAEPPRLDKETPTHPPKQSFTPPIKYSDNISN